MMLSFSKGSVVIVDMRTAGAATGPGPIESEQAFINWTSQAATPITTLDPAKDNSDLETVGEAVSNARVVMISEAYHNSGEIMRLHHRVIRYLVENHGFNTVVAKTCLPESRAIHDYVLGDNYYHNYEQQTRGKSARFAGLNGREVDESLINVRPGEWDGMFFLDHATGATPVSER